MKKAVKNIYFVNGKFVEMSKAKVSVLDLGLIRGFGVFDFLVTYSGVPFMLKAHIDRLYKSAELIGLFLPWTKKEIKATILNTLSKNKGRYEKTIKIVITGGVVKDGISIGKKPSLIIIIGKRHIFPINIYKSGISIITLDHRRSDPLAKSLNYAYAIKGLQTAKSSGAHDFIYIDKKKNIIFEASRSNIFIVKNAVVYSPISGVLPGITKAVVSKIASKHFIYKEKGITLSDLLHADEVFLTSSDREIVPVIKIDGKKVADGKPGPVTAKVISEFRKVTDGKEVKNQ